MINQKDYLLELIEQLPEDKIDSAIELIQPLLKQSADSVNATADPLNDFLAIVVSSLANSLYDLSVESERNGAKIAANRLDFSRKKITEAWDGYKKRTIKSGSQ